PGATATTTYHEHTAAEGRRVRRFPSPRGHRRQHHGEQPPANAIAHAIDSLRTGDLFHNIQRAEWSQCHVVLEGDFFHRGIGVLPTDDKDGETRIHQELDEAILWLHIQNVVLVDPGWDKQEGDGVDLFSRWSILDQLDQLIAIDHLARR